MNATVSIKRAILIAATLGAAFAAAGWATVLILARIFL
jgi:hypothetical protein